MEWLRKIIAKRRARKVFLYTTYWIGPTLVLVLPDREIKLSEPMEILGAVNILVEYFLGRRNHTRETE